MTSARAATVALSAALLASCGDDDFKPVDKSSDEAAKVLTAAPEKTRAAHTARTALSMEYEGRPLFHASGIGRFDPGFTRLVIIYDTDAGKLRAGESVDAVIDGEDVYVRLREPGANWVHTPDDPSDPNFDTGVADSLDYLSAVTGNARRTGFTTVRGKRARAYSATVDLDRVADHLPADQRGAYRRRILSYGISRLPVKVGIDDRGRIVSMDYSFSLRGQSVELHFVLYDFGADGNLSPPKHFVEG